MRKLLGADKQILLQVQEKLRHDAITPYMKTITFLADGGWFGLLISFLFMLRKSTRAIGACIAATMAIGAIITNVVLKNTVCRSRPFHDEEMEELTTLIKEPTDWSFPSGHTTAAFAVAGIITRMCSEVWGKAAYAIAGLIGFSRLYLGVHYPTDVLVGLAVGTFSSGFIHTGYQKLFHK